MLRRSRFDYGESSWTTELSVKPWMPADSTVGGSRTSAAGIPAAYVVRRDELVELVLRVTEAEWPTLLALVTYGQTSATFLWYPEVADNAPVEVYLEAPLAGDRWGPVRVGGYERLFEVTLTLRAVDASTPAWLAYFNED